MYKGDDGIMRQSAKERLENDENEKLLTRKKKLSALRQTSRGFYDPPAKPKIFESKLDSPIMCCMTYDPVPDKHGVSSGKSVILSGCKDGSIIISDYATLEMVNTIRVHEDAVMCLKVYQPPGQALICVVSGSKDKTVKVTIMLSGEEVVDLTGHSGAVWAIDMLHQHNKEPLVVSGSLDGTVGVWSILHKKMLRSIKSNGGSVLSAKIFASSATLEFLRHNSSEDNFEKERELMIFGACEDRVLRMWSLQTGKLIRKFEGFPQRITDVTFLIPDDFIFFEAEQQFTGHAGVRAGRAFQKRQKELEKYAEERDEIVKTSVFGILFVENFVQFWSRIAGIVSAILLCGVCRNAIYSSTNEKQHSQNKDALWKQFETVEDGDLRLTRKEAIVIASCLDGKVRIYLAKSGYLIRTLYDQSLSGDDVRYPAYSLSVFQPQQVKKIVETNGNQQEKHDMDMQANPLHSSGLQGIADGVLDGLKQGTNFLGGIFGDGNNTEKETAVNTTEPRVIATFKDGSVVSWYISTGSQFSKRKMASCAMPGITVSSSLDPINEVINENDADRLARLHNKRTHDNKFDTGDSVDDCYPVIVTGGVDGVLRKLVVTYDFEQCKDAYENDKLYKVPRELAAQIPQEFAKYPRIYLLTQEYGSIESYFAGQSFKLFFIAVYEGNSEFIKVFLPYAKSGLLLSNRRSIIQKEVHQNKVAKAEFDSKYLLERSSFSFYYSYVLARPWKLFQSRFDFKGLLVDKNASSNDLNSSVTILRLAIDRQNIASIRTILVMWIEILEKKPVDLLDQTAGPGMMIDKYDLICLADKFPLEFEWFICNIKAVPVNDMLQKNCNFTMDKFRKRVNMHSQGKLEQDILMWKRGDESGLQEELTCFYIPLISPANLEFIECLVNVSGKLRSLKIFDSEFGKTITSYAWSSFGRNQHIANFVNYIISLAMFFIFLTVGVRAPYGIENHRSETFNIAITYVNVWVICYFVYSSYSDIRKSIQKQQYSNKGALRLFANGWVGLELFTMITKIYFVLAAATTRHSLGENSIRIGLSITSLSSYIRVLYFFRSFESTGLLVALLFEILRDMGFYLIIVVLIITGFGEAFWVLQGKFPLREAINITDDDGDDVVPNPISGEPPNYFGTLRSSILGVYDIAFNGYDPSIFENKSNALLQFSLLLAALVSFFVSVIILNLLIAFISDVFGTMINRGSAQLRLMQMKTITDNACFISQRYNNPENISLRDPKFIHFVRRNKDLDFEAIQNKLTGDDGDGKVLGQVKEANEKAISVINDRIKQQRERLNESTLLLKKVSGRFDTLAGIEKKKKRK